ncbi:hypothetical protein GCM10009775_13350 [Microbacterium aoyamense]|uniref:DUF2470 domain-containing protein n=1 Tax=Microbacterium aoyamense TaxID=344166 RepID=A0ABN2PHP8_9MICO|nr:DUF2470 domain-containing protein [Microbacterium aoyamense]
MTHIFDESVRSAVLGHMNGDHGDDNLLIARAFGPDADATSSTMVDFDGDGGDWLAVSPTGGTVDVRVPWPGGPISERPEVRREIVALYDLACGRLGVAPRPHA